jgi:hypothetical protein
MDLSMPWSFWLTMGAMLPIYLLVIPFLVGLVPEAIAKVGVVIATLWTVAAGSYLVGWLGTTHHLSGWTLLATALLIITPVPLIFASTRIIAKGVLVGALVYVGALLLHAGMFIGMSTDHMPG